MLFCRYEFVNFKHNFLFSILGEVPKKETLTPIAPWENDSLGSSNPSTVPIGPENLQLLQVKIQQLEQQVKQQQEEQKEFQQKLQEQKLQNDKQIEKERKESDLVKQELKLENHNLKVDKEKLRKTVAQLKSDKASKKLSPKVFKDPKISNSVKRDIVHEVLKPYFTEAMINWFLRKPKEGKQKRGWNWSTTDFTIALTIRRLSAKTFNYIRSKNLIPLPGMSTIRQHYANFVLEEGHFSQVHTLLGLMALEMTERQKIVVLSFDEVNTKGDITFDVKQDRVVGPHCDINVMMVRGLYGNFKIPIWAGYDKKMTKELLFDIINKVEADGFEIRGIVFDCGNQGVMSELGFYASFALLLSMLHMKKMWVTSSVLLVRGVFVHLFDCEQSAIIHFITLCGQSHPTPLLLRGKRTNDA